MPSPFPGMNSYLESSHIGEDFYSRLAAEISDQLNKRRTLSLSYVNLVEVDLLRQGERHPIAPTLPPNPYFIFVRRNNETSLGIWPLDIDKPIPIVPISLLDTDHDIPLDLGQALHNIYDRAAYDLRLDYSEPPPPPDLSPETQNWLDEHLQTQGLCQIHDKN
ncbi:MAG: DUF4058 family protein [Chloroflexota bacterium]